MQINFPYLLTSLIALASIIAPIITAFINNKHLLKMKEREAQLEHSKELETNIVQLFQRYLSSIGQAVDNPTPENLSTYRELYFSTLIYVPKDKVSNYGEVYDYVTGTKDWMFGDDTGRKDAIKNCLEDAVLPIIRHIINNHH